MSQKSQPRFSSSEFPQEEIQGGFRRRLIVAVSALFLTTMFFFLVASYFSERNLHFRETFEHLDETLGILAVLLQDADDTSTAWLGDVEARLEKRTRVPHRVFLANDHSLILGSSDPALVGQNIHAVFGMGSLKSGEERWSTAFRDGNGWLVSSSDHSIEGSEKKVMYLMRWRRSSEEFVGRFLGLHGLHVAVTLILFFLFFHFLVARYVRQPIQRLAAHIRRVEKGDFKPDEEIEGDDEFGWLARRFNQMGKALNETVQRLVRAEKFATVSVVSFRIAREMKEPIEAWQRHILYLEGLAKKDPEMIKIGSSLREDRRKVTEVIRRLNAIRPHEEGEAMS